MHLTVDWSTNSIVLKAPYPKSLPTRFKYFEDEAMYYGEYTHHIQFFSYLGPNHKFGPVINLPLINGNNHLLIGPTTGNTADVNRFRLWERYPGSQSPAVHVQWRNRDWYISHSFAMSLPHHGDFHIVCVSRDIVYQSWTQVPKNEPFTFKPSMESKCLKFKTP